MFRIRSLTFALCRSKMRERLGQRITKLTALAVNNAKPGRHADGKGLFLLVKDTGAKSWMLRVQIDGKRRDIGLGSVAAPSAQRAKKGEADESAIEIPLLHRKILTLSEAREKAGILRTVANKLIFNKRRWRSRHKPPLFTPPLIAWKGAEMKASSRIAAIKFPISAPLTSN